MQEGCGQEHVWDGNLNEEINEVFLTLMIGHCMYMCITYCINFTQCYAVYRIENKKHCVTRTHYSLGEKSLYCEWLVHRLNFHADIMQKMFQRSGQGPMAYKHFNKILKNGAI